MDANKQAYIEKVGKMCEELGLTHIGGKLLGYLLVCGKEGVFFQEFVEQLGVSKASVSTNLNVLISIRFVAKVKLKTERRSRYQISTIDMLAIMQERTQLLEHYADIMDEGLALLADERSAATDFMRETRDFYRWMKDRIPHLLEAYRKTR